MELTSNLLQFLVTLLGFCLGAILYHQNRRQAYFLLACFYGCFALGSLYWTLYLLLFSETPRVFYVSEFGWIASMIFLRILQYALSGEEERAFKCRAAWISPPRWRSADGAVLRLWRHSLQSDLVRPGDGSRLRLHTGACLREGADWTRPGYAVFSHRGLVLCRRGKCPLDFWLPLAERRHFGALLLV